MGIFRCCFSVTQHANLTETLRPSVHEFVLGRARRIAEITYVRTQQGFAYPAVVIDRFSRRVVGLSMQSRQTTDVVLQPLLMAMWRRKPKEKV